MAKLAKAGGVQPGRRPAGGGRGGGPGSGILSQIFVPKLLKMFPFDLKILSGRVGVFGATLAGVSNYLAIVGKNWFEWYQQIQDTRKALGLTEPDTKKFGMEVLGMTAKFGVAMDRVGNIARFVGQGTDVARSGIVKLAGALANISESSGASEDSVKHFGFLLNRTLGLSTEMTARVSTGILAVARSGHVAMEDLQNDLMAGRDAIFVASKQIGGPEAINRFAALATGMREAGAESRDVQAIMGALTDRSSKLFQTFAGSGYDLQVLQNYMRGIAKQIQAGSLSAAAAGDIWDKLGAVTLAKLADSTLDSTQRLNTFNTTLKMSEEQRKNFVESTLSPIDKIKRTFREFMADQTQAMEAILGGWEKWAVISDVLLEKFRGMTKAIGGFIFQMMEWNAEANRATEADKKIALINTFAKQIQRESQGFFGGGLSNVEANTIARQRLIEQHKAGVPLSAADKEIIFGKAANVAPTAESPGSSRDPAVELQKRQLQQLQEINTNLERAQTQETLRSARYGGGGADGTSSTHPNSPMVDTQRY